MPQPNRPPTANELLANRIVTEAIERAWADSEAHDPLDRHEEGGWIYMDLTTGAISTRRAPTGGQASIDLSNPPLIDGSVVVAKFHTHPNPSSEGWNPGPSKADLSIDARHGVPDLIRADNGTHLSGPDGRRGGLSGDAGYPA
jgi:hypothetical protein